MSPDRVPAGRGASARRRLPSSPARRWTALALGTGTVVSLATLPGPAWLVRAGVVLAVTAALVSCLLAWRELELERRRHAADLRAVARAHGHHLAEQRRHAAAVLDTQTGRLRAVTALAATRQRAIDRLEREVARLRTANGMLTRDRNLRDRRIAELREALREREAELAARQRPTAVAAPDCLADLERRGIDLGELVAVTLPNYEDDRRFA